MIKIPALAIIIIALFFSACSSKKIANTDVEVADVFVKSLNNNKFDEAEKYLLHDKTNMEYFDITKKNMLNKAVNELDAYKNANLIIHETKPQGDTITFINYSNSNKLSQSNNLKLVKINGQWLVDLKFTFLNK
jgi:Domain of unknown function (DUF4878)